MSARDFEESPAELLRAMEYIDVKRVGSTADRARARWFGLRDGWNAVITGEKEKKIKILIKSNGEITEQ